MYESINLYEYVISKTYFRSRCSIECKYKGHVYFQNLRKHLRNVSVDVCIVVNVVNINGYVFVFVFLYRNY